MTEHAQEVERLPGDTDGHQDVDLDDLNNIRNYFRTRDPRGDADGNVDLDDLNLARNQFGASGASTTVVLEPVHKASSAAGDADMRFHVLTLSAQRQAQTLAIDALFDVFGEIDRVLSPRAVRRPFVRA